ncbi:hypothetical protein C3L33_05163, partial [Rhododendron williamsianum]
MAPAIAIETNPPVMTLRPSESRKFTVTLTVRSVTGSYSFGEVLMKGSGGHRVKIPVVAMDSGSALGIMFSRAESVVGF